MNLNYKKLSGNQILKMMKNKSRLISVLMLLLLAILITIPAFFPNRLPLSWDGTLHMARFTQISDALRHGKLPPLIAFYGAGDNLNAFVGMYPWLADLIIVIPMTFIANKMIALLIGYFLLNIITGLNVYLLLSELTKSRVYRLLGTTLYLFNSYHIIDLYARVEWGEGVAYAFFPLVALGLLRIYKGKKYGIIFLSLGMIGLANSHLLSLLGAIILLVIIELYRMVTRKFSIKELKDFVLATVISLIASSYTFFQILLISLKNKDIKVPARGINQVSLSKSFNEMISNTIHEWYDGWNLGIVFSFIILFLLIRLLASQGAIHEWGGVYNCCVIFPLGDF